MQLLQAQALGQPECATGSDVGAGLVANRIRAFFAAIAARFRHAERDAGSPVEGHAWTDSLERELNNDIAICRRIRF